MPTHEDITRAVQKIAPSYPIKTVAYFGSYANGNQTDKSDLDLLVEFSRKCLLELIGFKQDMEEELDMSVDVVPFPLKKDTILEIERMVSIYG